MKVFFLRLISIGIISGILFLNLRTLYAFIRAKDVKSRSVNALQSIGTSEEKMVMEAPPIVEAKKRVHSCNPIIKQNGGANTQKKVVLRLDDINAGIQVGIFKKFVVDTQRYHAPLVLGITPEGLETNTELSTFLESESCNLEFAIHGWDHFSAQTTTGDQRFITEFSEITFEDALVRLKKAKDVLSSMSDEKITTFIPPYSSISEGGKMAAKQMGIKIISSIGTGIYDAQVRENKFEEKRKFSKTTVLESCKGSLEENDICVVLLHLDDFLKNGNNELDQTIYYEYLGLLEDFSKNGYEFTTFSRL